MDTFDNIKTFLLNLSFVFILFSFYHKFIEGKISSISHKYFIGIISSISIVFCMTFTISPVPNFIFDMRQVPFIIGALYGGRRVAFVLLMVLLSYRGLIGIEQGFYAAVLVYCILFAIIFFVIPYFTKAHRINTKLFITFVVSCMGVLTLATVVYFYGFRIDVNSLLILFKLYITQIAATVLFIKYIEKSREDLIVLKEAKNIEKLKIVSEIAASVSHEVRNPLTVTKGFLQLLKEANIPEDKKQMYIKLSLDELNRAESIITDYLSFAKPSLKNTEKLDLYRELHYVVKVVEPYATMHNIEIKYKEVFDEIYVMGERQLLHQCLINIAKNGVEAMPDGGDLTIEVTETSTQALIKISDTGTGMSKEQIDRLGSPYYSTKEKGTGLGTMVVFSIVKSMQGKVEVESVLGEGTTFTIRLPRLL